jgi:hypothetical protein
MTPHQVRELARALPEAEEQAHFEKLPVDAWEAARAIR